MIHICVCICTFRRPTLLQRLLCELERQETGGLFEFSIVIADNDDGQSARPVVADLAATYSLPIIYCVEPEQNIALARNRALSNTWGEFVAFIDDDEIPEPGWLRNLFTICTSLGVEGVLGPVLPRYEHEPPRWIVKGKFFERPAHVTGYLMKWRETRTGNVLFRRDILEGEKAPFDPEFGTGGEDVDFFRRMIDKGGRFVWCNEAVVTETVPDARCNHRYLLRRALNRGSNFRKRKTHRISALGRSVVAVPLYALALPVLSLFGRHVAIRYLIKLCDHASRIAGFLGWELQRERT